MTKVVNRTDDVAGFFSRAKSAAQRADQGEAFDGTVTLSFEDPQRMFTVLSQSRRQLILEVMSEPRTINELSHRLHRNRSTVAKDVALLEKLGLLVSHRQANPAGHSIQKLVRCVAPSMVNFLQGFHRQHQYPNCARTWLRKAEAIAFTSSVLCFTGAFSMNFESALGSSTQIPSALLSKASTNQPGKTTTGQT